MIPEGHIARVLWENDFEKTERHAIEYLLKPGMCVLNIGANTGLYVLLCSKIVGEHGEVHAFEPASLNYARLLQNIALNKLTNVRVTRCAVSDRSGTMLIHRDPKHPELDSHYTADATRVSAADFVESTPSITVDEYWAKNTCEFSRPIDLMIIDVEGGELGVFEGAKKILRASQNVVIMAECTKHLSEIAGLLAVEGLGFYQWDSGAERLVTTELTQGNVFITRQQ